MAYDKVIDSSVLDANLESVANAIRTKGGTSANLAFPTGFVNAISAIEAGGGNVEKREITFASDITNTEKTILTADSFVKEHYPDDGFTAVLMPVDYTAVNTSTNAYVPFVYLGNRILLKTGSTNYFGFMFRGGSSVAGLQACVTKLSGTGWNVSLRAQSNGNMTIYVSSTFKVPAGSYYLVMSNAE